MNINISFENFNNNKMYPIIVLIMWIVCVLFGVMFITYINGQYQSTYFIQLYINDYLNVAFGMFFSIFILSFFFAHIKIITREQTKVNESLDSFKKRTEYNAAKIIRR